MDLHKAPIQDTVIFTHLTRIRNNELKNNLVSTPYVSYRDCEYNVKYDDPFY